MKKLFLFIASALMSVSTMATNISGSVNASALADDSEVVLTGNTNLYMDVNKTIKSIQADYPLTISGGNILTVNNPNGDAIRSNGDISISGGSLVVSAGASGIYTPNGNVVLDCSSDITAIEGRAIYVREGNVSLSGNTIKLKTSSSRYAAVQAGHAETNDWAEGSITISGGTVTASSNYDVISSIGGDITISGNVTLTTPGYAICAGAIDFSLIGGNCTAGDIFLNGTFNIQGGEYAIFAYGGDITLLSGSIIANGTIYAGQEGNITLNGDVDVTASANKQAIYANEGNLLITGNVDATSTAKYAAAIQAGHAKTNDFGIGSVSISGGTIKVSSEYDAITAIGGDINLSGNVTLRTPGYAICAGALDFSFIGGDCTAGNVILNGTFDILGRDYAIFAYDGNITLQSGSITSIGAIYAKQDITINGNLDAHYARTNKRPCIEAGSSDPYYWKVGNVNITGESIKIDAVNDAIVANGGNISISGTATIKSRSDAILAGGLDFSLIGGECYAGNVTLNGTFNIQGRESAIYAYDGKLTLLNGRITSEGAIYAKQDITINGNINATCTDAEQPCIKAGSHDLNFYKVANITIAGDEINIHAVNDAIQANGGDIKLSGYAVITSEKATAVDAWWFDFTQIGGELYAGDVIFDKGEYSLKGKEFAVESKGHIAYKSTKYLSVVSPSNGRLMVEVISDGISRNTIVDAESHPATFVHISAPPISGAVALSTAPSPGNDLSFTLSGDIAEAEIENIWQISDDDATWQDILENAPAGVPAQDGVSRARKVASELVYVPTEDQVGKYIRVKVAAADHTGYLYSPSRQIAKKLCTDVPVVPTLTNINDKVYLSNAKTTQEYIIFNYSKDASSLTASDWNNAVTPESEVGFFELGGSSNANNTVFTRVKETPSTLVGEQIAEARLYIGTSVYMTDVELSVSKTVGHFQNFNNELNCKVGDVIRCDASPVPSNATNWYGVSGSNWTVDFHNTGSQYGAFYEDAECTRPISSSSNYSTVYLKTLQEKNYLDVRILVYNSAIGYKTRYVQFNVTPDGYFPLLDYINGCDHTIAAGEKITGIEVSRRPFSGSVYGLTTEVSGDGTAPIVSFSLYETMTINAINATPGVYVYTPLQNGHPLNNNTTFTITVTDGKYAVDSLILRENAITADPNEELELVAQLMPSNSEAAITWTSSNTSVATVTNGIVTIAANAPIGAKATITATANGKSDECQVTVSGEEYDLYVASTRVTSRNRDDILGDGRFAFDGMNTLAIKGNYTISNSANLVRNTGIDGLIIDVAQACTISQGSESYSTLFDLRKNTTIRGEQMTVNGNGVAFNTQGGTTLTLDSANLVVSAIMPFKGSSLSEDTLSIINSRLEVNASGSAAVFSFNGGISLTDCYIQTPAGGEVANGAIEDGNGSQVRNLLIVPYKEKRVAWMAFIPLEVNATVGDELEEPMLLNPEQLSVTYSSSDPSVATVDALTGDLTLVAAGITTITATFAGNEEYLPIEASYTLTVTASGDGTGIEDILVTPSEETRKLLIDGTLYILRPDGKVFNAQGVEVK